MDESTVGDAKKGNKNLVWTRAMDDCLIDIMLEMVKNNQYQNGTFRPGTYKEMERQLNLLEPECGVRVDPHIQSRLKTLKKKYNGVKELRNLSGAGWNDALKQVEIDPIVYKEYIQNRRPCKGLNRVPIARYDDLAIIYGNSGSTGKGARGIKDLVPNEDDIFDIDKELGDEASMHYEVNATMEDGEEIEKEAEAESVSVGKELLAELKPMMEVFTASLGDALRGETVVEHEPVQDELARMRKGIQDELETLNGLTPIEKIQAALILVDSGARIEGTPLPIHTEYLVPSSAEGCLRLDFVFPNVPPPLASCTNDNHFLQLTLATDFEEVEDPDEVRSVSLGFFINLVSCP
ncbi:hypothetical protein LINGRAHAP2_LOCUS7787 [Linum grandiflorum]